MNLALWAAAASGVQVGATIVASRHLVAELPPLTLALLRYAIAAACLLPLVWRSALDWPRALRSPAAPGLWRDSLAVAALGIGQFAILIALLNWGLQRVGATQAALIFSLFPLLALLFSALAGRDRPTALLLGGSLLSVAGVAVSLAPRLAAAGGFGNDWLGDLAVLASAAIGALCSVLYRPYLQRHPALPLSAYAMGVSALFLALLAWPENWPQRVAAMGTGTWTLVAFVGLSSAAAYAAWLYALKHETPARVTVFLALNPPTAALLGAWLLGEPLDAWQAAGMALVALGLAAATRRPATIIGP